MKENETIIMLLVRGKGKFKIPKNTYLVHHGERVAASKIDNYELDKKIEIDYDVEKFYYVRFPVTIQRSDTIDYVSYLNKKETKKGLTVYGIRLK